MAWNFYDGNANSFVREYGLMPERLERTGLTGVAKDVFLDRLGRIHATIKELRAKAEQEALEKGGT